MRRRVHLLGPYAQFHEGPIEVEARTVWDAVEAVTSQIKGFLPDIHTGRKKISVPGYDTIEKLRGPSDDEDIYIMPAMTFGKEGGVIETILGVTLVVVSFFLGGPQISMLAMTLFSAGMLLSTGGLMQMLTPQPQLNTGNEDRVRSKYLPSTQNTVKIGTPIPILYGRYRVGGHILSLNIDARDTGL